MPNVPNYAREMEAVLRTLEGRRPRLLLHACCGPCSSAVLEQLSQYFDITILYYNPNIWPAEEYHRREEELERFVARPGPGGRARAGGAVHRLLPAADAPGGPVRRRTRI